MNRSHVRTLLQPSSTVGNANPLTLSLSSDQSRLSTSSSDYSSRWDMASGKELRMILTGHQELVNYLTFSPDGKWLVSASNDKTLKAWDLETGVCISTLRGHSAEVLAVAFSPVGDQIASCAKDNTIRIWSSTTFLPIMVLHRPQTTVSIAYSPDGKSIACGATNGIVRVRNACSDQEIVSLSCHASSVSSLVFTPDGRQIISGSKDGTLRIWDSFAARLVKVVDITPKRTVYSLTISSNGRQVVAAIGRGGLLSWIICNGDLIPDKIPPIGVNVYSVAFASGGLVLHTDHAPYFYDLRKQKLIPFRYTDRRLPNRRLHATSSQGGSQAAFGEGNDIRVCSIPKNGVLLSTTLSPYSNLIVYAFLDGTVKLWDPQRGFSVGQQLLGSLQNIAFSSDNVLIAGVCDGKGIYLWNVATRELVCPVSRIGELPRVISIYFLTGRRTLVTSHIGSSVYAWSAISGRLVYRRVLSVVDIFLDSPLFSDDQEEPPREISGTRWYPPEQECSSVWAYLDGYIIMGCWEDSSVTVIPVTPRPDPRTAAIA